MPKLVKLVEIRFHKFKFLSIFALPNLLKLVRIIALGIRNKELRYNLKIKTMTKADIINEVARATGVEKVTVQAVLEASIDSIKNSVIKGEPVYLRGFGSFIIKHRAEKAARNITQKTTMTIPAHNIPAFKPSKAFSSELK